LIHDIEKDMIIEKPNQLKHPELSGDKEDLEVFRQSRNASEVGKDITKSINNSKQAPNEQIKK